MKFLIRFSAFLMCFGLGVWLYSNSNEAAQKALVEFYNYKGFEDKTTEPLWQAGDKVVPLVIENIKNKNMPRRMYAIGFLGAKRNPQALPVLEDIVRDETENNYLRKVASRSIFYIDENAAKEIAEEYKNKNDFLGSYANCILTEKVCF